MSPLEFVAMGYSYPRPGSAERLAAALATQKRGEVARHMRHLVDAVTPLSLGEWEELHTATLDLSAPFVPYVGHVEWGENYRRGAFMAELQAAMNAERIDLDGELPDHIALGSSLFERNLRWHLPNSLDLIEPLRCILQRID